MHSLISKIICIFSLMVLLQLPVFSQQVDRAIYSSAGRHATKNSLSIAYNIGEPITFTGTGMDVILSQGFEQPDQPIITNIPSSDRVMDILAFPNPVMDQLHVRITSGIINSDLRFELFDLLGKKISLLNPSASSVLNSTFSFDLSYCKPGIYFITVSAPNYVYNNTFKIIKE
jgi:hypothetical protein